MVYDDAGDGGLPINTSGIGSCVCLNCRGVLRGVNCELRSENVVLIEGVGSRCALNLFRFTSGWTMQDGFNIIAEFVQTEDCQDSSSLPRPYLLERWSEAGSAK